MPYIPCYFYGHTSVRENLQVSHKRLFLSLLDGMWTQTGNKSLMRTIHSLQSVTAFRRLYWFTNSYQNIPWTSYFLCNYMAESCNNAYLVISMKIKPWRKGNYSVLSTFFIGTLYNPKLILFEIKLKKLFDMSAWKVIWNGIVTSR